MSASSYDVLIIGAGPAGIQAAIHACRRKAGVLLVGRPENSALYKAHVENYAFVPGVTGGEELLRTGLNQVRGFGAEITDEDVLKVAHEDGLFQVELESGRTALTRSLIFCMGVAKTKLGVPGEEEFLGRGVSYCADCDANFYRGKVVAVTGDRSAAVDGALTLLGYAAKVYLVARELHVSAELLARLKASPVEHIPASIEEISGEEGVDTLFLNNGETLRVDGLFIELGSKGAMELATQIGVQLDAEWFKYIAVNRKQETTLPGVYAAGDITGPPFQIAKAVGEGCIAGLEAAAHVRRLQPAGEESGPDHIQEGR